MLREDLYIFDCIYSPRKTALVKMRKELGCKSIGGLGMMVYQGAATFKLFPGKEIPVEFITRLEIFPTS